MTTALILGAGHSACAGAPVTSDLLRVLPSRPSSAAAARRHQVVAAAFGRWTSEHATAGPEQFLEELAGGDGPVPYQWGVELMAAEINEALGIMRSSWTSPRYAESMRRPLGVDSLVAHWRRIDSEDKVTAVVTFNYDLVAERLLRPRPMNGMPGFFYGGVPEPQAAIGTTLWSTSLRSLAIVGEIPIFKLHGSLSWALRGSMLELRQDYSPALRDGCAAAHVPPRVEKELPGWLAPVWEGARVALGESSRWVVAGYSAPSYDRLAVELLRQCASSGRLRQIDVFSRSPRAVMWTRIASGADAADRGPIG